MSDTQPTNLYTLTEAIRAESERIAEMMERTNGDDAFLTAEDVEADTAFLEGLRTEAGLKADGYAVLLKILDEEEASRRRLAKHFAEMADKTAKQIDSTKRYLIQRMQRCGMKRLEGSAFSVSVQANGGKQPVQVFDGVTLPERFIRTNVETSPDNDKLRDALLSGDDEAKQYAELLPRGFHIVTR